MVRNIYLTLLMVIFSASAALAQAGAGSIKGVIKDSKTGEPIPFANVVVELGGIQIGSGQSNFDGEYIVKPVDPGSYVVKTSYVGYKPVATTGVIVSSGKITTVDVKLESSVVEIKTYEVIAYDVPLIDDYQGKTVTKEEIYALPTRNVNSVAATTAGVTQTDEGDGINIRGSRGEATFYFIDGIKVRGSANIPQQGIEQIQIITGGLPAMYGDATGGVISITTRGPSPDYHGGLEYVTSADGFGYNLLGFNLTGPLSFKTYANGQRKPNIGFFFSSELLSEADRDPSAVGITRLRKDRLEEIERNPLRPAPLGIGTVRNSQFVRENDFENIKRKENYGSKRASLSGKVDFKLNEQTNFTVGGTFDYFDYMLFSYNNTMFNADNNGREIDRTIRGYAKITQRLGGGAEEDAKSASIIKNAFYSVQADYTVSNFNIFNNEHRDNFFDYGYVGKFKTFKVPSYTFGGDTLNGQIPVVGIVQNGFRDTLFTFEPGTQNPLTANYTSAHYALANGVANGFYRNLTQVEQGGGLLNGSLPPSTYDLYTSPGTTYGSWLKAQNEQYRLVGQAAADIKGHEIMFGFEYEQRVDRSYSVAPIGLWTIMRQLSNRHIEQLDLNNPFGTFNEFGNFTDTLKYNRFYNPANQSFFDRNLRAQLGLAAAGTDWIDVDNLDPSTFSLTMFSPDELLNQGNSLVSYFGYDAYGNKVKGRRSLDSFFNDKDENGNFKRELGAFTPIYMAAYIQDKFAFKDLIFNVGLRVDRYDANQSVLKDPFSLYETRKAGEFIYNDELAKPSNIGDDYVVYVRDANNTDLTDVENIVGYRNGRRWYDADGREIADPIVIRQASNTGRATPALLDPNNQVVTSGAFTDYKPQVNFMPRIAFQFPISDVAQFFAHYDVLTQRPSDNRLNPIDYLFLANTTSSIINNPDLKPQRTIDYEVGYKQALNTSSALTFSVFYRELRNLIQLIPVAYAYPVDYSMFGNIDFGTVKGLSLAYDLRRTGNVRLTANYTLQFADGTGSSSTSGVNLIQSGNPNLRTAIPLSFDVRHQIQTTFDFRYDEGKFYNGPKLFGKNILENSGLNVVMIANSGTPYSRSSFFTADAQGSGRPILKGSINGSRLPFQFRINVRLDKTFTLQYGKKNGEDERKSADLQIYCLVQNLLDARNVVGVYRATGNASDDGFLEAATSQAQIANQVDPLAFADLYTAKVNNPNNFARPRIIRLGAILNF
jgi:outer membrane receptor protein involved in Fe transport